MPLRDGFFSTATQTSCCNRIQRSNRVRLLVVSTHDFPDTDIIESASFIDQIDRVFVMVAAVHHNSNSTYSIRGSKR